MRIGYTPEQEELRRELRAYFTKLMTPERAEALSSSDGEMGRGSVYREIVGDSQLLWTQSGRIVFPWEGDGWTHLYSVASTGGALFAAASARMRAARAASDDG